MQQKVQRKRTVPAVDRAARILALIETAARPMSITELATELAASKGTVREILETLRDHGLLDRDDATKLYRLGPQLVRLGVSSGDSQDLLSAARPILNQLSETQREVAVLLIPHHDRLLIQAAAAPTDPRTAILVSATPGRSFPATAGACGKVMLAWNPEIQRPALRKLPHAARAALRRDIEIMLQQGYAIDDQEFMTGVRGVSAPIMGTSGRLIGLVLVSGLAATLTVDRLVNCGQAARDAADAISRAIGGPGVVPPPMPVGLQSVPSDGAPDEGL